MDKMIVELFLFNLDRGQYRRLLSYTITQLYMYCNELPETLKISIPKIDKEIYTEIQKMKSDKNFVVIDKDEFVFIKNSKEEIDFINSLN